MRVFRCRQFFLLTAFCGLAASAASILFGRSAPKGTQYAFLVACSGYNKGQLQALTYTIDDVEDFRQVLLATGFDDEHIKVLHDRQKEPRYLPEKSKILKEFKLLLAGLEADDTTMVVLNGHGLHFKNEATSHFCPIDAKVLDKSTLIPMDGEGGFFPLLKGCRAKRLGIARHDRECLAVVCQ